MPIPLSWQTSSQKAPTRRASTRTTGARSGYRNFTALPRRFASSWARSSFSPRTTGRSPTSTSAPVSSITGCRSASTRRSVASRSTSVTSEPIRPTREKPSRSLIRRCIRLAPSTANPMYWSARSSSCPPYRLASSWVKLATFRNGSWRSCEATWANCSRSRLDRRSSSVCSSSTRCDASIWARASDASSSRTTSWARMCSTSRARAPTSPGPVSSTLWRTSPPATRRASAASSISGSVTNRRREIHSRTPITITLSASTAKAPVITSSQVRSSASAAAELRTWLEVMTGAFAVLALSVLVMGVLLWISLRRLVTDPLMELAADARRVAGGEVRHSVDETGPGEVGALARDVEHMRARLVVLLDEASDARAQIEASHLVLEEQTEELRRSNSDLEQFAYVASHNLQEPLRKVASFTQLLASRYAGQLDERADQYIGFAVDGAKRMQHLINDLLGFSRVGRIGSEGTDVDLDATLRRVLADLQPVIDETGAEVEVGDLPVVRGEKLLLAQLLANLVGNALKFRHPDRAPVVRVDARRVGDVWELVCQDNGIGIDPAFAERVFVIFQRLHAKEVYEGTGIGLALCKKIVEYHGGTIWIDTSVTEGAAVRWTLPADVATVPPIDDVDAASGGGQDDA